MTCPCGHDKTKWQDQPDPKRKNWILTTCRQCGKFIGYREAAKK